MCPYLPTSVSYWRTSLLASSHFPLTCGSFYMKSCLDETPYCTINQQAGSKCERPASCSGDGTNPDPFTFMIVTDNSHRLGHML
jgi:hypothetical protein